MAFTKTSQKFGQWSDPRANTVYGLGFATENDLAKVSNVQALIILSCIFNHSLVLVNEHTMN